MSDGRLPPRRRWLGWTIGTLITVLILAVGWVAIRGIGAVTDLQQVATSASQLKTAIASRDLEKAETVSQKIEHHAASAHSLTSDPVWQAFGVLPWIGPNFRAVSEISAIADDVASDALAPVLETATGLDLSSLGLSAGAIDLTPFAAAEAPLSDAATTLSSAETRAQRIDAEATLPALAEAVDELRTAVTQAATVVGSLHGAASLLPPMLGAEAPRNYVIAMQNNAESRSDGGIIGAIALIHAEGGRITLAQQASTRDFPALETPLPVSESTTALFEDGPGRHLQNITSIPDFAEAAPLIATRWQERFGTAVDGVIAVDAVLASHLLDATGPVAVGPFTADGDNVVSLLLSEIYAAVPDPAAQDEIFAQAAAGMLGAAFSTADPQKLLGALADAAGDDRIRIWSAHEDEQVFLASTTLGGILPSDGDAGSHVGVLINDTTGGKMDYYADAEITTATGVCRGEPTTQVRVTWTNDAPPDAATALPAYVTADGAYGVPAGSTRTLIAIYGPEGATASRIDRDGAEESVQTALLGTRTAVQHEVILAPGESTTITVEFQGEGAGDRLTRVSHTPLVREVAIDRQDIRCTP
ncbi:DUF4012 domain-containing protein [Microbacterium sp. ZW T5_45]|uniref:DUF4012 domain-containing protein n=1 Tax=Microbacterium sp. ZW T5_45 TaxID=3378080 RepID=UPI0038544EF1